jgi:hypothetical protein
MPQVVRASKSGWVFREQVGKRGQKSAPAFNEPAESGADLSPPRPPLSLIDRAERVGVASHARVIVGTDVVDLPAARMSARCGGGQRLAFRIRL